MDGLWRRGVCGGERWVCVGPAASLACDMVVGPSQLPASLPISCPPKAMRWMENGAPGSSAKRANSAASLIRAIAWLPSRPPSRLPCSRENSLSLSTSPMSFTLRKPADGLGGTFCCGGPPSTSTSDAGVREAPSAA